jgi:hypothetical protein
VCLRYTAQSISRLQAKDAEIEQNCAHCAHFDVAFARVMVKSQSFCFFLLLFPVEQRVCANIVETQK